MKRIMNYILGLLLLAVRFFGLLEFRCQLITFPFLYLDVLVFTLRRIMVENFTSAADGDVSFRLPGEEFQPVLCARLVFQS
jgi:hypothetical protein